GSGGQTIEGQKVTSWYIVKPWNPEKREPEISRLFTPAEEAELAQIGHRDWYSWCIENWGTKWNACHTNIDHSTIQHNYLEIFFNTAWSAPTPVFHKMREMFPKLTFECRWRYEDDDPFPHSLEDEPETPGPALIAAAEVHHETSARPCCL